MAARPYPSFLIFFDTAHQYRWHFQAENHRIIANSGEAYHHYNDCLSAIGLLQSPYPVWQTNDVTNAIS